MKNTQIFQDKPEVDSKLSALGVTKQELITAAIKAVTARNDATPIDPISAPGLLAYIYGVRALREMLLPKPGWKIDRTDNIEGTLNPELNIKILYQNVDSACVDNHFPRAVSGKGNASKRLVENNTAFLWPDMEDEFNTQANMSIWFLCVSVNNGEIRAELSRPRSIENKQFGEFLERIYIIDDNDWNPVIDDTDLDDQDFDIQVTRK